MAQVVLLTTIQLSLMILLGFVLGKAGYLTRERSEFLSALVLDVFFPCATVAAAGSDTGGGSVWPVIGLCFALLFLFTAAAYPAAKLLGLDRDHTLVFTRSAAFPNNGFMGLPLCAAVFGERGALWAALTVPGTSLYLFSMILLSFGRREEQKQGVRKYLTPLNLSVVAMLVMIAAKWSLPPVLQSVCSSMAACTTPAAMLSIGYLLSASPLLDTLRQPSLYVVTLLRNLAFPLLTAALLRLTGWNRELCLSLVMTLGCSVGSVVSIAAAHNHRAEGYAGQSMLQSTLLLPVTMPLMMFFADKIL